jgi:hypothetical protein
MDNNISALHDPSMRLQDFALGFIPIAKFHSYQLDGKTVKIKHDLSRTDKIDWNKDVWSKFDSVIDVRVVSK